MNSTVGAAASMVYRHTLITRLTHWVNAIAMAILLMSGLQILGAHPALYWGNAGFEPAHAWLRIDTVAGTPVRGYLTLGSTHIETSGFLGVSSSGGQQFSKAFPGWLTVPSWRDLTLGRRWHFFFAWVLVLNGATYLLAGALSGHLRRDLVPRASELGLRHLATELWNHLRLRFPHGEAALRYNTLQKLTYAGVIFVLGPLMVLTGLTMSPGINAAAPFLLDVFGGRQSARSIHFIAANLLMAFFVIHILALLAVGVWNELRSMITGRYRITRKV